MGDGKPFELKVRDLMTTDVVTVQPQTDLAAADAVMQLKRLRHLPVVDNGTLVGLITHRDLLHAQLSSTVSLSPQETAKLEKRIHAEEVMGRDVQTVPPDMDVVEAGRIMLDKQFGCLPVVEGGKLRGIVTEADLLGFFLRVLGAVG